MLGKGIVSVKTFSTLRTLVFHISCPERTVCTLVDVKSLLATKNRTAFTVELVAGTAMDFVVSFQIALAVKHFAASFDHAPDISLLGSTIVRPIADCEVIFRCADKVTVFYWTRDCRRQVA